MDEGTTFDILFLLAEVAVCHETPLISDD